jgi:hypothetical protein
LFTHKKVLSLDLKNRTAFIRLKVAESFIFPLSKFSRWEFGLAYALKEKAN